MAKERTDDKYLLIENQVYEEGLLIQDLECIIIRNCTISNKDGDFGIKLINCHDVIIESCIVQRVSNEKSIYLDSDSIDYNPKYIFVNLTAKGIYLTNCSHIRISKTEVVDIFGQGIVAHGDDSSMTKDIIIEENRIAYIYDDGIKFTIEGDQNPPITQQKPFNGGIVRNNVLHDIGLGVTRLHFARHGMYLKSVDVLVEGNTIYNCFYGSGISLRNSGIIKNNKIWNCAYACIAYHSQTITTEGTRNILVEGNECRQDYAFDIPMRHIYYPERSFNQCVQGAILIGLDDVVSKEETLTLESSSLLFVKSVKIINNKCILYRDYPTRIGQHAIPVVNIIGETDEIDVEVAGNHITDNRDEKLYILPVHKLAGNLIGK